MTVIEPSRLTDPGSYRDFPLYPPRYYFDPPENMPKGQKLTVITAGMRDHDGHESPGRVYGYVAPWGTCLVTGSKGQCLTAPPSPTAYAAAMQGDAITAEGDVLKVANIGGKVNHVPVYPGEFSQKVVDHYANTASQTMRVVYGENDFGIWAAGALWPDVDELTVARARAAALSGDWRWRPEFQAYDMAGAQMVNVPGYPLPRVAAIPTADGYPVLVGGMGGIPPEYLEEVHMRTVEYERDGCTYSVQVENDADAYETGKAIVAAIRSTPCGCEEGRTAAGKANQAVGKMVEALLADDEEQDAEDPNADPNAPVGEAPPKGKVPPGLAEYQKQHPPGAPKPGEPHPDDPNKVVGQDGEPIDPNDPNAPPPPPPPQPAGPDPQQQAAQAQASAKMALMEARVMDLEAAVLEQAGQINSLNKWLANEAAKSLDEDLADLDQQPPKLDGSTEFSQVEATPPAEDKANAEEASGEATPEEEPAEEEPAPEQQPQPEQQPEQAQPETPEEKAKRLARLKRK